MQETRVGQQREEERRTGQGRRGEERRAGQERREKKDLDDSKRRGGRNDTRGEGREKGP